MKRRTFLSLPLVLPAVPMLAVLPPANLPPKGIKVDANQDRFGQSFTFLGARFDLKVSGQDTAGAMSVYDTIRFEKTGPMLHSHTDLDEWFFVTEGEFKFQVGTEQFRLKAGDSMFGPRNVPHAFVKTSEEPGRILIMHLPAGSMEEYFLQARQLKNPTQAEREALLRKHNMIPTGPRLSPD
ncbi:cupin domain-containing protein [Hymenobacter radiodurans]|uniref:cupin domain-containing protein n=1 Tax=Hymenobacter radiodurans TaxID=2496028 RepID=UPI0010588BD0|nr:cupin domain-containing protein [Hymenobacter radiodurans]